MCHRNRGGQLGRGPKPPDLRPASNHVAESIMATTRSRCHACTGQRSSYIVWRAGSAVAVAAKRSSFCVDSQLRFRHRGGINGEPTSLDEQQAARTDLRGEGI